MSLSNLSVVFAPCLLRYPKANLFVFSIFDFNMFDCAFLIKKGSDALTAMTNTVREQCKMIILFISNQVFILNFLL